MIYEESIGTKMNDLDLWLEVAGTSHSPRNISETIIDRDLCPHNGLWGIEWSHDPWRMDGWMDG